MTQNDERNEVIKEQYGYTPSDLVWLLAKQIGEQYVRKAVATKLGKDTSTMDRMIQHHFNLIRTNVETDFLIERSKKYATE